MGDMRVDRTLWPPWAPPEKEKGGAGGDSNRTYDRGRINPLFTGVYGGGSAWESNPPRTATQPHYGFEDRGHHRAPSTPAAILRFEPVAVTVRQRTAREPHSR